MKCKKVKEIGRFLKKLLSENVAQVLVVSIALNNYVYEFEIHMKKWLNQFQILFKFKINCGNQNSDKTSNTVKMQIPN